MAGMATAAFPERIKMDASLATSTDICPVCKSTAQTSPNLRFKVSPKCYHRICEGCVDRKFSAGKAQCPISGCQQQLWKRDWKSQTFEDVQIEREVDIRRRVIKTLDRQEEDFETKRAFDDFLELREMLMMNLITNVDVAQTNKKLRDYEIANGLRKEKDDMGRQISKPPVRKTGDLADPSGLIEGLKKIYIPPPRSPYDAFMGMPRTRGYYDLKDKYETRYEQYRNHDQFSPAGYDFTAYEDECLNRAFAGLGVFLAEEKAGQQDMAMALDNPANNANNEVF